MTNMTEFYSRIYWLNKSDSLTTPLGKTNLNHMDSAIKTLDDRTVELYTEVVRLDTTKANKDQLKGMVTNWQIDDRTGVVTLTKYDGTKISINTALNQLAVNFEYNSTTQQLIITQTDGTKKIVDMSALITQYEFLNTDTISFEIQSDGKVKAIVKEGSIEEKHLQPNYLADIKVEVAKAKDYASDAQDSADNAAYDAKLSQSYAVGGSGIRDKENTDNSKYYSDQAKAFYKSAASITSYKTEYQASDSGTVIPGGTWETTIPSVGQGRFLWTKVTISLSNGENLIEYSVSYFGKDGESNLSTDSYSILNRFDTRPASINVNFTDSKYRERLTYMLATSSLIEGKPPVDCCVLSMGWDMNGFGSQLALGTYDNDARAFFRGCSQKNGFGNWIEFITSLNLNDILRFKATSVTDLDIDNVDLSAIGYAKANLFGQNEGALYCQVYNNKWVHQIFGDYRTGQIAVRAKNAGTWQPWRKILDIANFKQYAMPRVPEHGNEWNSGGWSSYSSVWINFRDGLTDEKATTLIDKYILGRGNATADSHNYASLLLKDLTATGIIKCNNSYVARELGINAVSGYVKFIQIKIAAKYINAPIIVNVGGRERKMYTLSITFKPIDGYDPDISQIYKYGAHNRYDIYYIKSATSTWDFFIQKNEPYGWIDVYSVHQPQDGITITYPNTQVSTLPSGYQSVSLGGEVYYANRVKDVGNGNDIGFNYSASAMAHTNVSWLAAWNGYTLQSVARNGFMGEILKSNYWGLAPNGVDTSWVRTTNQGIIPYEAGTRGNGHSYLGTDSWYFFNSYIDNMYGVKLDVTDIQLHHDSYLRCQMPSSSLNEGIHFFYSGNIIQLLPITNLRTQIGNLNFCIYSIYARYLHLDDSNSVEGKIFFKAVELYCAASNHFTIKAKSNVAGNNGQIPVGVEYHFYENSDSVWYVPFKDGKGYIGSSDTKWNQIYSTNPTVSTSDLREKKEVSYMGQKSIYVDTYMSDETLIDFIMGLKPIIFKRVDGESGRPHHGFGAQDVEELLNELGIKDHAAFIKSPVMKDIKYEEEEEYKDEETGEIKTHIVSKIRQEEVPGEYKYGMRYEELIADNIKATQILYKENQQLKIKVEQQEAEINVLKYRLEKIEQLLA